MDNNENVKFSQSKILFIVVILMCVTFVMQYISNKNYTEVHFFMRIAIVILSIILSIIDSYLKERKNMWIHLSWALIWTFNAIAIITIS